MDGCSGAACCLASLYALIVLFLSILFTTMSGVAGLHFSKKGSPERTISVCLMLLGLIALLAFFLLIYTAHKWLSELAP